MFFTVGIMQKQLKEIKASIDRERHDIPQFKYIESDCPGAQALNALCICYDTAEASTFRSTAIILRAGTFSLTVPF